jgi:hypothetical protein
MRLPMRPPMEKFEELFIFQRKECYEVSCNVFNVFS